MSWLFEFGWGLEIEIEIETGKEAVDSRKMEESESERVRELIGKAVGDWDDQVMTRARFKAFSGQRSDWEPVYLFWRDLILCVARQLGVFFISPSRLNTHWFNRGGLAPLCLPTVLVSLPIIYACFGYGLGLGTSTFSWFLVCLLFQFEMYNEGEVVLSVDLVDPTAGRLFQIFSRLSNSMAMLRTTPELLMSQDRLILTSLLKAFIFLFSISIAITLVLTSYSWSFDRGFVGCECIG